jgi:hypothetical protein
LFKVQFSTGIVKNLNKDNQLIDFIKIIIKDFQTSTLEANPLLDFLIISIYLLEKLRPQTAQDKL